MAKTVNALRWKGVLRLSIGDDLTVLGSDSHDLIGLTATAQTAAEEQLSIELVLSPETAAGLLAMLRDLEDDGRLPTDAIQSVKTTRQ